MRKAEPNKKRLRDCKLGEMVTLEGGIGPLFFGRVVEDRGHLWRKKEGMKDGHLPSVEACLGHLVQS